MNKPCTLIQDAAIGSYSKLYEYDWKTWKIFKDSIYGRINAINSIGSKLMIGGDFSIVGDYQNNYFAVFNAVVITPSRDKICKNTKDTLRVDSYYTDYVWQIYDNVSDSWKSAPNTKNSYEYITDKAGKYKVLYKDGTSAQETLPYDLLEEPNGFESAATITNDKGNDKFCPDSILRINATVGVTGNYDKLSYIWYHGNEMLPTIIKTHNANLVGDYKAKITRNDNKCVIETAPKTIGLKPAPAQPKTTVLTGTLMSVLYVKDYTPALIYEWYKNGAPQQKEFNKQYLTTKAAGTYYVTAGDPVGGCATKSANIIVAPFAKIASTYSIYPNPSVSKFNLLNPEGKMIDKIVIKSIMGIPLTAKNIGNDLPDQEFDLPYTQPGQYIIEIYSNRAMETMKLIIK